MAYCNENFLNLQGDYIFEKVAQKQKDYENKHRNSKIISLGTDYGTQPLIQAVASAMIKAVREPDTFFGYAPKRGYEFLRKMIAEKDFKTRNCDISIDEIFIGDRVKSDIADMQELFAATEIVGLTDPMDPDWAESNIIAGRSGKYIRSFFNKFEYLSCYKECGFKPMLPSHDPKIIYLCSPNNPTGIVLNKKDLTMWVRFAKQTGSVIFFDARYEAFISDENIPHSIYEIEGAKEVAVEFHSYSNLTGLHCGYTIVPEELMLETKKDKENVSAHTLWSRSRDIKSDGCSYISQRGAEALYTEEGKKQIETTLSVYKENAKLMLEVLKETDTDVSGGVNSPYIWMTVPEGETSWDFFDRLLEEAEVICIPGSEFGPSGEGYVRLSAFNTPELTRTAMDRIKKALVKLK